MIVAFLLELILAKLLCFLKLVYFNSFKYCNKWITSYFRL